MSDYEIFMYGIYIDPDEVVATIRLHYNPDALTRMLPGAFVEEQAEIDYSAITREVSG